MLGEHSTSQATSPAPGGLTLRKMLGFPCLLGRKMELRITANHKLLHRAVSQEVTNVKIPHILNCASDVCNRLTFSWLCHTHDHEDVT